MVSDIDFLSIAELNLINNGVPLINGAGVCFILQDLDNLTVFSVVLVVIKVGFVGNIDPNSITHMIFRHGV